MTVYELYIEGKLHPAVTRQSVIFYCEIYALFVQTREQLGYTEALYVVSDKKCVSPKTVEKAVTYCKKPL